jgi:hypothetical protein
MWRSILFSRRAITSKDSTRLSARSLIHERALAIAVSSVSIV